MSCQLILLVLSAALAGRRSSLVNVAQPQPQEPPTAKQQLKNDDQRTVTVRVNPETGAFEELSGDGTVRQVTFHGVNYVRKGAPYIADTLECGGGGTQPACPPPVPCPGLEPCPSTFLLTDADAAFLVKRGINVVRVGLMWRGAMPIGPDVYNASYFAQVEKVIDLLWKHGIYSILDLHQDLLSPRLCGEGAPVWANFTQAALGGLQLPLPVGKTALPMLPSGLPNCSGSKPFPNFYSADLVGRSFEAIYSDTPPQMLGTQLANLWGEVSRRFGRKAGVLAYELMNEPAVGDAVQHPELQLHPERADRAQLAPFYAKVCHYMTQPLVELYGGCIVVLKVSWCGSMPSWTQQFGSTTTTRCSCTRRSRLGTFSLLPLGLRLDRAVTSTTIGRRWSFTTVSITYRHQTQVHHRNRSF
jgi:hypothetical protein